MGPFLLSTLGGAIGHHSEVSEFVDPFSAAVVTGCCFSFANMSSAGAAELMVGPRAHELELVT